MRDKILHEFDFEDIKMPAKERLKLPSRRVLSSKPWSEEQMRMMVGRQKNMKHIWDTAGIKFVRSYMYEDLEKEWKAE